MKIPTSFIYVIDGISSCNLVTDVINLLLPICLSVRHAITKASQAEWEEQEKRVENARAFDPCCQATGQVTVNFVSCSPLLRRLPASTYSCARYRKIFASPSTSRPLWLRDVDFDLIWFTSFEWATAARERCATI